MKLRIAFLLPSLGWLQGAAAWNHISEARFRQALRNDYTLAACKSAVLRTVDDKAHELTRCLLLLNSC